MTLDALSCNEAIIAFEVADAPRALRRSARLTLAEPLVELSALLPRQHELVETAVLVMKNQAEPAGGAVLEFDPSRVLHGALCNMGRRHRPIRSGRWPACSTTGIAADP